MGELDQAQSSIAVLLNVQNPNPSTNSVLPTQTSPHKGDGVIMLKRSLLVTHI